jgi:hypothetical protein
MASAGTGVETGPQASAVCNKLECGRLVGEHEGGEEEEDEEEEVVARKKSAIAQ